MAAIFDVGLKCASPKTILEMMANTKDLTPDHIKSHLQKYRLHANRCVVYVCVCVHVPMCVCLWWRAVGAVVVYDRSGARPHHQRPKDKGAKTPISN